jgi:hypothetical protein
MTPLSEEAKLIILGLIVAVVVAGSAYTVTRLLAAGADHEKAAVATATAAAQHTADIQTDSWRARAAAAETSQGVEHASIENLRVTLAALAVPGGVPGRTAAPRVPASPIAPASAGAPAAPVVRQSVVCEASEDLRSDYGDALAADAVVADYRSLYDSWPFSPPPR